MMKFLKKLNNLIRPFNQNSVEGLKLSIRSQIDKYGSIVYDARFNRHVKDVSGYHIVLDENSIELFRNVPVQIKYSKDWDKMRSWLIWCVREVKKDPYSRQLLMSNMGNYYTRFPCFNTFQFKYTQRGEFDLYVYQRSQDLAKWIDDIAFFRSVSKEFEKKTGYKVTKFIIIYGSIHETAEKQGYPYL